MWAHTFSPYLCCYRSLSLYVCVIVSVDRFTASLSVERVFIGAPPAYVCVVCFSPFLYPGSGADQWWRAVQAGVINDDEVIAFEASVPSAGKAKEGRGLCQLPPPGGGGHGTGGVRPSVRAGAARWGPPGVRPHHLPAAGA